MKPKERKRRGDPAVGQFPRRANEALSPGPDAHEHWSSNPTKRELRFEPPGPEPESQSYLLKFASSRWLR